MTIETPRPTPQGTLWVCVDCMLTEATGELPADLDADQPAPWARESATDVTPGLLRSEHNDGCEGDWEQGCYCEHREFSWSQCDGCGSTLGGSRHAYTWWE